MTQANSNPNEMLTQLEALTDHGELEHQSIKWWNSYAGGGFPNHDGSGDFGTQVAENAIPNVSFLAFGERCSFMLVNEFLH